MLLRMNFVQSYILDRNPTEFKTPTERDWAYCVRREYVYDCNIRAAADATAAGLTGMLLR
jgi:hypothetical protein